MKHAKSFSGSGRKSRPGRFRAAALLLSVLLLLGVTVAGTLAYLSMSTSPVENTFMPSKVSCKVTEDFDGTVKSNVNVINTSDIAAYIRVRLVTYRVNDAGQHIGGTATIPDFTPGTGWVKGSDGCYYYTEPVAAGGKPATDLTSTSITLEGSYSDADGGKQVIEVMAEAIQSVPEQAVRQAWGVSISQGHVTPYSGS